VPIESEGIGFGSIGIYCLSLGIELTIIFKNIVDS
jgi:hypothetical protein